MSFRREKTDAQRRSNVWHAWIEKHRAELIAIGLSAEVFLDEKHWSDFLQNGHFHWHESSGFEFGDLSQGQVAALHRFLEREYGSTGNSPPLLGWIRIRSGMA